MARGPLLSSTKTGNRKRGFLTDGERAALLAGNPCDDDQAGDDLDRFFKRRLIALNRTLDQSVERVVVARDAEKQQILMGKRTTDEAVTVKGVGQGGAPSTDRDPAMASWHT